MQNPDNHKCEEDRVAIKKPKISSKLAICPKCKKKQFVVSIFGSICGECFYEEKI